MAMRWSSGFLTTVGDAYSHASHYRIPYAEHIVTGAISRLLTLAASYLFDDRAQRLRAAWARVFRMTYPLTF
jgi:hypothetical protein